MKASWEIKSLGEVCRIVNGGTPKTGVIEYWNGSNLWITPAEMGNRISPYVADTSRKITDLGLRNSSAQMLPPKSVILSSRAPIGHLVINTEPMATNQGCKGLIPSSQIDYKFLYYFLSINIDLLNSLGTGATFKELSGVKLSSVMLPIPPLSEQRRIVKKLDDFTEYVANAKLATGRNLQNSKDLFDSYLQTIFASPGVDWEQKRIKEIGVTQTGLTPKTTNRKYYGNFIPFITPADVDIFGNGTIRYSTRGLSKEGLMVGRKIDKNSVLMVCIGATIGKVGFSTREISCNQQINTLTPHDKYDPKIFYYILSTREFFSEVLKNSSQATLPIINKGKWENMAVTFPKSLAEQKIIVRKLEALSVQTKELEKIYKQKLADLDELKKSVFNKAFTGEL